MFDFLRNKVIKKPDEGDLYVCKIHGTFKNDGKNIVSFMNSEPICAKCFVNFLDDNFSVRRKNDYVPFQASN